MQALANARVLADDGFVSDRVLLLDGERIVALTPKDDPRIAKAERRDLQGAYLMPGFIDCQVNGGGGVLFNDDPSVEAIRAIGRAHRRYGTTGFMPTLISDDLSVIAKAIASVRSAMEARIPGVLGIHVEGPFINALRKGAHDPAKLRELDATGVALLSSLGAGKMLVTLAPEVTRPETIRQLTDAGVVVSAGHTNGTYDEVAEAFRHGASGVTHLFNAMSPLSHREPGAVGAALSDENCWCGLIVDGRHVHPVALKLALRCKRPDRFMLVTDAMPSVGSSRDSFMLQGKPIFVKDGVCVDENGTLSGSHIDMATAVKNTVQMLDVPLEQAARMASAYPAEFLGLGKELGRIAPGYRANLVACDDRLQVKETWIDGHSSR